MRNFLYSIVVLLAVNGTASAENLTPVDVPELRAQILASDPTGPVELRIRNKGRILFSQTERVVVFTKAGGTAPRVDTAITEIGGNRFCVDKGRGWSGLCVEMFQTEGGGYICRGQYGNGYGFDERDCWIKIPR